MPEQTTRQQAAAQEWSHRSLSIVTMLARSFTKTSILRSQPQEAAKFRDIIASLICFCLTVDTSLSLVAIPFSPTTWSRGGRWQWGPQEDSPGHLGRPHSEYEGYWQAISSWVKTAWPWTTKVLVQWWMPFGDLLLPHTSATYFCHIHVTLVDMARDLLWELHNALWHHLTPQQLDLSASYKRKLAQYSLYGHNSRGEEETEEATYLNFSLKMLQSLLSVAPLWSTREK